MCSPQELLDILLVNGFTVESIRLAMGSKFPHIANPDLDFKKIANIALTLPDRQFTIQKILTDKLQLYVLEDFLLPEECDYLIKKGTSTLTPSTIVRLADENKLANIAGTADLTTRSSQTGYLDASKDSKIAQIDQRICEAMGIHQSYSEMTQLQQYRVGQHYKNHNDYFMPGTDELNVYAAVRGNRTWTFMVYLKEGMEGGGTHFPRINKVFLPKVGTAVVWNNRYPDGRVNPDTLHAGMPVLAGEKFVITKWFREKGQGKMFL